MNTSTRMMLALAALALAVACRPKAPEGESPVADAPETPAPQTRSEDPATGGPVLSIAPDVNMAEPVRGGGPGITPMDVAGRGPKVSPSGPPSVATKGEEAAGGGPAPTIQLPDNLPPGIPIPDFSALGEDIVVESVTVTKAAPGEGPVGPDGKVIDPNSIILGRGIEPAAGPDSQPTPGSGSAPRPPSTAGRALDPSEAPPRPPLPVDGKKKEE